MINYILVLALASVACDASFYGKPLNLFGHGNSKLLSEKAKAVISEPVVKIDAVTSFRGVKFEDGLFSFKGIPFAQPPIGPLRSAELET